MSKLCATESRNEQTLEWLISVCDNPLTETQKRKAKYAAARARKAQTGAATIPSKDKGKIATGEIPFEDKLFNLAPGAKSKKLDKKQVTKVFTIIEALRACLMCVPTPWASMTSPTFSEPKAVLRWPKE